MEYVPINLLLVKSLDRAKELEKELGLVNQISMEDFYALKGTYPNRRLQARAIIEERHGALVIPEQPLTVYILMNGDINEGLNLMDKFIDEHKLEQVGQNSGKDYIAYFFTQPVVWFNF